MAFRQRMFVYHYRIFDRYGVEVVSLAVCTDDVPVAHTAPYQTARWGCELTFGFLSSEYRNLPASGPRSNKRGTPLRWS